MVRVSIGLLGMQNLFGGDFSRVVEVARMADDAGIDIVSLTDHVVMGEHTENYPYGAFPVPSDFPWYEPLTVLAAIASNTSRIRLSTGILISPLRPAVLLAKQLATLDVMSRGRVEIGFGIGWQREEYDASGVPWEGRYNRMDEQVAVCKALWSEAPADFHGKTAEFAKIHAYPRPVQSGGIPIWFGLKPTERNFARMAALGDGWIPMERKPSVLAEHMAGLRAAYSAAGRDPATVQMRVGVRPAVPAGKDRPDFDATMATVPALIEAGATVVEFIPSAWCKTPDEMPDFFARLVAWRNSVR
jgi:probable F420-dependent oxidoreductase